MIQGKQVYTCVRMDDFLVALTEKVGFVNDATGAEECVCHTLPECGMRPADGRPGWMCHTGFLVAQQTSMGRADCKACSVGDGA